jgi:hypothetical protein
MVEYRRDTRDEGFRGERGGCLEEHGISGVSCGPRPGLGQLRIAAPQRITIIKSFAEKERKTACSG